MNFFGVPIIVEYPLCSAKSCMNQIKPGDGWVIYVHGTKLLKLCNKCKQTMTAMAATYMVNLDLVCLN